jgi:hypothetical protein
MRADKRGIIFRNAARFGNRLTVRCSAENRPHARRRWNCKAAGSCSAAEFGSRHRSCGHRRQRHGFAGRRRHLQLPHRKHPRRDRAGLRLIRRFAGLLPGERRRSVRAIFFEIGKHEIMLRQLPITFAEFDRRRILGRQLAPGRSSTVTLRRRDVISHLLPAENEKRTSLLGGSAMGQGVCG